MELAGEVRTLLAGVEFPGLAAQLILEPDLVADVARRALDAGEAAVGVDHADRPDVDGHAAAVRSGQDERCLLLAGRIGDELRPAITGDRPARLIDEG